MCRTVPAGATSSTPQAVRISADNDKNGESLMKIAFFAIPILLSGCAAIPVQETTLRNTDGGSVTCKQVGRGIVSYGVGKSIYEDCIAKAQAQGYK